MFFAVLLADSFLNFLTISYYVCEKSDGIRYLLYLTADEQGNEIHYLIDRKNDYWWIHQRNLHFPLKDDVQNFHTGTLIDGELVMDKVNGRDEPKFLVFDCLVIDGQQNLVPKPLDKRLGYFREHIMNPYTDLFRQYPDEARFQAFKVEMKEMQFAYGIEMMFRQVIPNLAHGNDGLIFTCRSSPYEFGTDPHIVKWKPPADNTVDFRMRLAFPTVEPDADDAADGVTDSYVDFDGIPQADLYVFLGHGGKDPYQRFKPLYIAPDEWETLKSLGDPLQNRIVECALDDEGRWRLHRFRDDKNEANHVNTVNSVMESIEDRVTEKDLFDAAYSIKEQYKLRRAK